ncbi:MAG: hypothetical protein U9Q08_00225 [Candidatus Omnitrophota bacterium]|nr:hypothetical protein [Candidatus Omnitrophota bacterium]
MKKLRLCVMALLIGILAFSGLFLCQTAKAASMDNSQFAAILVSILGFSMPADTDALSDAELFEIQSNMLAEAGVSSFADAEPGVSVTRGELANVLYDALIGPNNATVEDKIRHLANSDYLGGGETGDIMNSADVISALNIPALSTAIAEGYSLPGGPAARFAGTAGAETITLMPPAPRTDLDN